MEMKVGDGAGDRDFVHSKGDVWERLLSGLFSIFLGKSNGTGSIPKFRPVQ